MHESFLHYVWQFQYFDKRELKTTEGEGLDVLTQGVLNTNAGPDFGNARIQIGGMAWAGTIEIHVKASEWNVHKHQDDRAYDNVVLHVVWQNDKPVYRSDGSALPTLELKKRVDESLLLRYRKLVESGLGVPCAKSIAQVPDLVKLSMLERAVLHRLERKAQVVMDQLSLNKGDWEETTYQVVAANFGFKVNTEPFSVLSKAISYKTILKHTSQLLQVEALLFGQAGLLEKEIKDEHFLTLKREYRVLASKYQLESTKLKASQWRFLRLRPANFPTLRIAQFASLLVHQPNLFSKIKDAQSQADLQRLFPTHMGSYWQTHYRFGMEAKGPTPDLGSSSKENIIINSIAPLLVAYGREHNDQTYIDRAVEVLQALPAEKNRILKAWTDLGWKVSNGFDSQGLIELYNSFCASRQCLNCAIGAALIKPR